MKLFVLFAVLLAFLSQVVCHGNRTRRHLIYPVAGGIFKLILGIGIPVKLGMRQSMAVGMNFQFQYKVPTNITELEKPYPPIIARSERRRKRQSMLTSDDRNFIYMALEADMNRMGINGKECLLRTICENAKDNLQHESNGLWGELLHILLTPLHETLRYYNQDDPNVDDRYVEAQKAGEYGVHCDTLYPDCPPNGNLLDELTVWDN